MAEKNINNERVPTVYSVASKRMAWATRSGHGALGSRNGQSEERATATVEYIGYCLP